MKLIYYEIRKNFLRPFILIAIVLLVIINGINIFVNYRNGGSELDTITPHNSSTVQWNYYRKLQSEYNGEITSAKVRKLVDEYKRLNDEVKAFNYKTNYDENTETGYINSDYNILAKYIYQPMDYMIHYNIEMDKKLLLANENIDFYEEFNNPFELSKNKYIISHYGNRDIDDFYDINPWEQVISYKFSDLLILLLIILGVVPIYINEKDIKMDILLRSSKKGKVALRSVKFISAWLYVIFVSSIFALMNILFFAIIYEGLPGAAMPLYAIPSYVNTPLNCTIVAYYFISYLLKCFSFMVFSLIICIMSKYLRTTAIAFLGSFLLMVGATYLSGYLQAVTPMLKFLSLLSPLTLLESEMLFKTLIGINFFGRFQLSFVACLCVQIVFLCILFFVLNVGEIKIFVFHRIRKDRYYGV